MSRQSIPSNLDNSMLVLRGISVALGAATLLVAGSANALPNHGIDAEPGSGFQVAQQAPTSGDVVVDTEPRQPDQTTNPGSERTSGSGTSTVGDSRFSCEMNGGQPTVMYHPQSQPGGSYAWAQPGTLGGGWSADRRCAEIARRLESYRPDGLLEMQTAVENGYNTVCVTTQKMSMCRIVLTVPPGENPILIRDRVFRNLTVADSGQQTDAVNTYRRGSNGELLKDAERLLKVRLPDLSKLGKIGDLTKIGRRSSNGIDLRPFLAPEDGGSGKYLKGAASSRPATRLNPDQFR